MDLEELQTLLKSNIPDSEVVVTGDGRHFDAFIISSKFEEMSLVARQREVYKIVGQYIADGSLHALSIKAKTPLEWQHEKR